MHFIPSLARWFISTNLNKIQEIHLQYFHLSSIDTLTIHIHSHPFQIMLHCSKANTVVIFLLHSKWCALLYTPGSIWYGPSQSNQPSHPSVLSPAFHIEANICAAMAHQQWRLRCAKAKSKPQSAMIPPHRWPKDIQRIAMFPLITSCIILPWQNRWKWRACQTN